ncbi:MAG: zinc ABC transporter solute-binding protein [Euryarchaeota archaeon]|nr:zinc ABC transporter solute-binding protein [Euryarchaeota archaeon]
MRTLLLIAVSFILIASSISFTDAATEKIRVVSTLQIFSSIVQKIGGMYVSSDYIVPAGTDIHDYSLTQNDIAKIKASALVVLANSNFFSIDAHIRSVAQGKRVLDFDDYNATIFSVGAIKEDYHGYWLYPKNAVGIASAVASALSGMAPEYRSYFLSNLESFENELNGTLTLAKNMVSRSGLDGAGVILAVPGVLYVAKSMGFRIAGILTEGPNQFVSPQELARMKDAIMAGKVAMVINAQNLEASRAGEIALELSRQTGVKIAYVDIFSATNYTAVILSNAAVLSSVPYVERAGAGTCDITPFIIVVTGLIAIAVFVSYLAYVYRRELLK